MNDFYVIVNAINALYGLSGRSLVRLTVGTPEENVHVQLLYHRDASDSEVERYRDFCTELYSTLSRGQLDEQLIPIDSVLEAQSIAPLPVQIYCVHGAEFAGSPDGVA